MNLINNTSLKALLIPLIILLLYYSIHLYFFTPYWPFNFDTFDKINFIVNLQSIDFHNQHHLRWGSYLPLKIISFFFDINFISLTLISFFCFVSASIIFLYVSHKLLGLFYTIIFLLFYLTSKSLNFEIFSLSVTNQSLLPLSLILLFLIHIHNYKLNFFNAFSLALIIFWSYGVKETNLFFFPLLFLLKIFRENINFTLKVIIIGLFFYIAETIILNYYSDQTFVFGRIFALLSKDSGHLEAMSFSNDIFHFTELSTLESYFIPFYRWYSARDWDTTIFYISFVLSIMYLSNSSYNKIIKINSSLILSFFIFTTFFLLSFFPPKMGQPFMTRFLTILLPFSFISIIYFFQIIIEKSSNKFISAGLLLIVLLTFFSKPIYSLLRVNENWGYLSLSSHYGYNPWKRSDDFEKLVIEINNYDCIVINSSNPFVKNTLVYMPYLINKSVDINNWHYENSMFKKIKHIDCSNTITIKENGIIF